MPELPEVETTRRGLAPHVEGRRVTDVVLRRPDLRWPIPPEITTVLPGQRIDTVRRRAKYLLLDTSVGSALLHLGMSGSLRVLPAATPAGTHDHVDIALESRPLESRALESRALGSSDMQRDGAGVQRVLRFNDPRRFGCLLWQPAGETHALLRGLGPEPLSDTFDGGYLFARSRGRSAPVKTFLMDQRIVVGVGNIYAAEALFAAGIAPQRAAGRIARERYVLLADAVKAVLAHAITRGGTTLRDFLTPDGAPGYFEQELLAYGREGEPCKRCGRPLKHAWIGQRASVWCALCQR
ncbi:MAG: bifunctional DNA-formamidopyrimidine glycosylase/DNA-(apurinic or apyrimidinic site) lyase [Luteimonas sp.]